MSDFVTFSINVSPFHQAKKLLIRPDLDPHTTGRLFVLVCHTWFQNEIRSVILMLALIMPKYWEDSKIA
jgi:hypothetical protein